MQPFRIRGGCFAVKVVVLIFYNKIRRLLKDERGEANYFSTVVFIFIAVLLLAFILNLFSIISAKQELDHCADQMVKQIQLSGGTNSETEELFDFLCSQITGADNISYSIEASYKSRYSITRRTGSASSCTTRRARMCRKRQRIPAIKEKAPSSRQGAPACRIRRR